MASNLQKDVDNFVSNILDFRPDVQFQVLELDIISKSPVRLAASGVKRISEDVRRVGVLTNPAQDIIIRVFFDEREDVYHLYFLGEKVQHLQFSVVTSPNSFKYFIIDSDGHTEIPKDSQINPIEDPLSLTFPKACFQLEPFVLAKDRSKHLTNSQGITLRYEYNPEEKVIHFHCSVEKIADKNLPSKLLISTGQVREEDYFVRFVPFRDSDASVQLPDKISETLNVCLYE